LTGGAQAVSERRSQRPHRGEKIFTGYDGTPDELRSAGTQRVELASKAESIVEALDGGDRVLARETSKRRDTLDWHPYARAIPLPPGTRAARLTWMSHRKPTSGEGNDAAFDELYLGERRRDRTREAARRQLPRRRRRRERRRCAMG
jgi:hypothetical protein